MKPRAYKPKPCERCDRMIEHPTSGKQRWHPECARLKKRDEARTYSKTVPCGRCGRPLKVARRVRQYCRDCKTERYQAKLEARRTPTTLTARGRRRRAPVLLARDFLLVLPEARVELARACSHDGSIWIERGDPARLR